MVMVIAKIIHKQIRRFKRRLRSNQFVLTLSAVVLFTGIISYAIYMSNQRLTVDPTSYKPLLQLIAHAESKDNYNAYFGDANNTTIDFTTMTVAQVMEWQANYLKQGNPSDAVGRYQIISPTLKGLVKELNIDTSQKFDAYLQDKLAIALLKRRGGDNYVNKQLSRHEFAANLAKEWAGLPKTIGKNPESSYYAGDGLNQSLVDVDDVLKAIAPIKPK